MGSMHRTKDRSIDPSIDVPIINHTLCVTLTIDVMLPQQQQHGTF